MSKYNWSSQGMLIAWCDEPYVILYYYDVFFCHHWQVFLSTLQLAPLRGSKFMNLIRATLRALGPLFQYQSAAISMQTCTHSALFWRNNLGIGIGVSPNIRIALFPTCQVRVVRFYQSCSRLALLVLVRLLLRQVLRQRPSSVCTTGPQPGPCPAQCAPLDLNLGYARRYAR